jgi:tetratricopeptide (TPR) repeat protein
MLKRLRMTPRGARLAASASLAALAALTLPAQAVPNSALTLSVKPGVIVPITDTALFRMGYQASASALFGLPSSDLAMGPELGYSRQALQAAPDALSILTMGLSARYTAQLNPWLKLSPGAQGGYFLAMAPGAASQTGRSLYFGGALGLSFPFGRSFSLDLEGGYRSFQGLFNAVTVSLAGNLALGEGAASGKPTGPAQAPAAAPEAKPVLLKAQGVSLAEPSLVPVFPVLFKFYDDHPLGAISIANGSAGAIENVQVSLFINQYMDNPKLCATIPRIEAGATAKADLFALFNDKMMDISEGTKLSARISIEYTAAGAPRAEEKVATVRVFDRNASMWDDDRKAAAFVTAKDPAVLRFSKNVLAMVKDKGSRAVNKNLLVAMALHEATRVYGLTYVTDPANSYAAVLNDKTAVDFLQFPSQTLDYKGGNCSALSILYAALLESVGIETAFITVPGHILMAISLGLPPERARKDFRSPDDLILAGDKSWLPIETTDRGAGFLAAWQEGAKEWRENLAKAQAVLYPVHDAWALYEPVGFRAEAASQALPDGDKVAAAYLGELVRYIDNEIYAEAARLQAEIDRSQGSPKSVNELGVLYARYGLSDRAEAKFKLALAGGDYAPALVNLGNVYYLQGQTDKALTFYERAQKQAPDSTAVLLAIAQANHKLENYGVAKLAYERLKVTAPAIAERFAYLQLRGAEGTRAAEISGTQDQVIWGQE